MTITVDREADLLASVPTGLLINGQWRDAAGGRTLDVHDPATGKVLASIADGGSEDALAALDAASAAQAGWARTAPRVRGEILRKAFELITERAEDFALLMTLEMGKPLAEARGEVAYGAEFLRWYSEEAVRDYGRYLTSPEGKNKILVQHKPVGPCLLITPWNFPLAMATRKVGPAVAAGCTMVLKPAKLTPLTAQLFAQVMQEAGLPDGVLNVVAASSAAAISGPLLKDSRLRKVSFTGSTAVGKQLMAAATQNVLRTSMELGGNAPFIVFEDADLDKAVEGAMAAKMRNMGEACTAANRFLVHTSVARNSPRKFAARIGALLGGPRHGGRHRRRAHDRGKGACRHPRTRHRSGCRGCHGRRPAATSSRVRATSTSPRFWAMYPTMQRSCSQEIFGPVAPVTTFTDEDHAIKSPTPPNTDWPPTCTARDFSRLLRVSEQLEFGMVGFNAGVISNAAAPFGGVKHSGLGREGGSEGIAEYTTTQYIGIADPYQD